MTITVDASPMFNMHRTRGIGRYVKELIGALLPLLDENVELLVPSSRGQALPWPEAKVKRYPYCTLNRSGLEWLSGSVLSSVSFAWSAKPAMFHATDYNVMPMGRYRKIVTVYDTIQLSGPENRVHRNLWRAAYKRYMSSADLVVAISQTTRQALMENSVVPADKIVVIYPGTDHLSPGPYWSPDTSPSETQKAGAPYLLVVGAADNTKGIGLVLESVRAASTSDFGVRFVGGWHIDQRTHFAAEVARFGLQDRVNHYGYVSDEELARLLKSASGLVAFSSIEGFGFPVFEALRSGTPVIYNGVNPTYVELLSDLASAYAARTVEELAGAMTSLTQNLVTIDSNTQHFLERLTWARCAQAHIDLYRQLGVL